MSSDVTAVVVSNRAQTRSVEVLGMKCNDREMPDFAADQAASYFVVEMAGFHGPAHDLSDEGVVGAQVNRKYSGQACVGIDKGRDGFIAILSPGAATEPAVWVHAPLGQLKASTSGTKGMFSKRPEQVRVDFGGWTFLMGGVLELDRSDGMAIARKEAVLAKALGCAA